MELVSRFFPVMRVRYKGEDKGQSNSEQSKAAHESDRMDLSGFNLDKLPFYGRVLLLQGPVGPFFRRVADLFEERGAKVTKVNFNTGDDWFYPDGDIIRFKGSIEQWRADLPALITEGGFDAIFLFGDCRPIHRPVRCIANAADCALWVFEEGYFRPNYVTLERDGVNAFSPLAKLQPEELLAEPLAHVPLPEAFPFSFRRMAWQAFTYFMVMYFGSMRYPKYVHHKPTGVAESLRWVRCWTRKLFYGWCQAATVEQVLAEDRKKRFFVFPLQVHNDAQIHTHADSDVLQLCMREVVESFARHASADDWLVIKHHPLDRGHTNYRKMIDALSAELGLSGRLHYLHDVHLPTLFDHCKGLVTVNSTAGLQALHHRLPVKTLGRSLYNKPGLTYQGTLESFWTTDWKPDHDLYLRFRAWTIAKTQINTSFYADPNCGSKRRRSLEDTAVGEYSSVG